MKTKTKFSKAAIKSFKRFIHEGEAATFQIFDEKKDSKQKPQVINGKLTTTVLDTLESCNKRGGAVTMMINKGDGKGRKENNVIAVNAVFVDADGQCTLADLKKAPIKPHVIVKTSPERFHAYWLIKGLPPERFKRVQKQLAAKFHTDASVIDLPRVMRMPGTTNWKHDKPYLVREVYRAENVTPLSWKTFRKTMSLGKAKGDGTALAPAASQKNLILRIEKALTTIPADDRHTWLNVGMAIHSELPNETGYGIWTSWSDKSKKFDADDQRRTWDGFRADGQTRVGTLFGMAKSYAWQLPAGTPESELELAELFGANHQDRLRWVETESRWYFWNGQVWRRETSAVIRLAREFVKAQILIAKASGNADPGQAGRSKTVAALKSMLAYAVATEVLQANKGDFDKNPELLGVENGVVELGSGQFHHAAATDMISRTASVTFDANADCPRWLQFVLEIFNGDKATSRFLQIAIGYTLFGHTKEQAFLILIGAGANGKGVFMQTVRKILGEYSNVVASALLVNAFSNGNAPSPGIMKMAGRRFLMCTELKKDKPLDEAFVKQLSGGDPISARGLYGDQEEFQPVGTLWLSVNKMPIVTFSDKSMWRRIIPIPFNRRFIGKDSDPSLEDKLAEEMPGILNWMLEGARLYQAEGLKLSPKCKKFRTRLRLGVDTVGMWIKAECKEDADAELQASTGYKTYSDYMRAEKQKPVTRIEFKKTLKEKGYHPKKRHDHNVYVGLNLVNPY